VTRIAARALAAVAVLCLATGCMTSMRKAPDYSARLHQIHKIGLMPPSAHATLIVFKGDNQELPEVEKQARADLTESLVAEVHQHDFLIDPVVIEAPPPAGPAVASQPAETAAAADAGAPAVVPASVEPPATETSDPAETRFAATEAQKAVDAALSEMFADPVISKGRALAYKRSLGPEMNRFADMVNADALLFSRYTYMTKSSGEMAKDVTASVLIAVATLGSVIPIPNRSAAQLAVCLVDGATGDVLFANLAPLEQNGGALPIGQLVGAAMKGFTDPN
jgi:hypothetical protein